MDDLGANNRNGTTNTDRTNFFEDVPVSALERTLFLESDRMGFLTNEQMASANPFKVKAAAGQYPEPDRAAAGDGGAQVCPA